jgi:hypothetical protein
LLFAIFVTQLLYVVFVKELIKYNARGNKSVFELLVTGRKERVNKGGGVNRYLILNN